MATNIKFKFGECEITQIYFVQQITNTDFRENLPRELTEIEIAQMALHELQKRPSKNTNKGYKDNDNMNELKFD